MSPRLLMFRLPTRALALAAVALLAGCAAAPDKFAPPCPSARLLPDAADLTRFNGRGEDVADMTLNARLTAVRAECSDAGRGVVRARMLGVVMDLTRGPALPERAVRVPLFIAVTEGDRLLTEKDFSVAVSFPVNVDRINVTEDTDGTEILLPVSAEKSAAAYSIFVAFRLTKEELDYNRRTVRK
jgi:hypothetical protein